MIQSAEQVTPEWLTTTLCEQGILPCGKVTEVTPGSPRSTFASRVWHLDVSYSPEAPPGAPKKLFLKASNPALAPGEFDLHSLHQEILFYRQIAPAMPDPPAVPCYHAGYDPQTGSSHLLLQDVSETHAACPDPSCETNCQQAVETLAGFHSFWWDHPRLGKDVGSFPTRQEREQEWSEAERSVAGFMTALGDRLRRSWRETYQSVLAVLPGLYQRHATGRNLTLAHGDAHLGNYLCPRRPGKGRTYLVDWQFWHPTIGGTDLAFLMATEWEPELRRRLEEPLLQRYLARLAALGVNDYSWTECWDDYRLSVILVSIFIPVWRWSIFKWELDLAALERSMEAFEDLKCADLLRK